MVEIFQVYTIQLATYLNSYYYLVKQLALFSSDGPVLNLWFGPGFGTFTSVPTILGTSSSALVPVSTACYQNLSTIFSGDP